MRWPTRCAVGAAAGLSAALACAEFDDTQRRAGDVLSLALPAATWAAEVARGDGTAARQFGQAFVVTVAAAELLKHVTGVPRPDDSNELSFPSGHAARAFAAAAFVHRRHGLDDAWPLYALATWVGHTRVQAARHRWVDVAGAAGVAWLANAWRVDRTHRGAEAPGARRAAIALTLSLPLF